jgi:PEP-CTERM motif
MNRLTFGRIFSLMAMSAIAAAPSASQAALLYEQVFNPPAAGQSGAILPWSINMIGGFEGTYDGGFASANVPPGLVDADTNAPIGRTGPADLAGTALYTGIGGAVTGDLRAFYTVDGQGGFSAVDPATTPGLTFGIWANLQGGGASDFGSFIFEGQTGGNRGPKQWYASTSPMAAPTATGAGFNHRTLLYNGAAGNWNLLTLDGTNAVAPILGGAAGAIPAGTQIIGVGVLHSVTNPAGDFSSWNYSNYQLTQVPEPASLVLMACAGIALVGFGRCKR